MEWRVVDNHHKHVAPWCRKPAFPAPNLFKGGHSSRCVSVVGGGCHDKKNAVCVVEPGWANTGAEEKVLIGGRRIDGVIRLECAKLNMD